MNQEQLCQSLQAKWGDKIVEASIGDMLTLEVAPADIKNICYGLRDAAEFAFVCLSDICGVDYLDYGKSEWRQDFSTTDNYTRAVSDDLIATSVKWSKPRYAVVYHLLSHKLNTRLRLKVYLEAEPSVDSVIDVWSAANWFEREAYDLFGIFFEGHPDLRRIMTDYGFRGHPFRKDFPLIGEVEMRYDAAKEACIYEPVTIQPRKLVPKVIRHDNRYIKLEDEEGNPHV